MTFSTLSAMLTALAIAGIVLAQSHSVALLPVVNTSPEPDEFFRKEMAETAFAFLAKGFASNGFRVMDPAAVASAVDKSGVDLTDEEQYVRETFYKVGAAAQADYVYFAEVEGNGFFSANTGRAVIRVWFLDVKGHKRILSARAISGESKERVGGGPKRTQVVAASRAAESSLKMALESMGLDYKQPGE